jgi:hypothetical protein
MVKRLQPIRSLGYELAPNLASSNNQSQNRNKNSGCMAAQGCGSFEKNKQTNIAQKEQLQL